MKIDHHLWIKHRGICYFCYKRCTPYDDQNKIVKLDNDTATKEHLHPRCLNGFHGMDNLVLACMKCNSDHSNIIDEPSRRAANLLKEYYGRPIEEDQS